LASFAAESTRPTGVSKKWDISGGMAVPETALNYWNQNYFLRDHKYWQT